MKGGRYFRKNPGAEPERIEYPGNYSKRKKPESTRTAPRQVAPAPAKDKGDNRQEGSSS